ncbi:unannotated protein [freshwater metagenome]|uniref:Unannotated protein n=1 Tax=freshwater metagenome TaxID=449393 RepID=A0A6J6U1F6_9ZZZZ
MIVACPSLLGMLHDNRTCPLLGVRVSAMGTLGVVGA